MKVCLITNEFGFCKVVCGTETDAQEMILAITEEALYESYYTYEHRDSPRSGRSFWESIARYNLIVTKEDDKKYATIEGLALYMSCDCDYQEFEVM